MHSGIEQAREDWRAQTRRRIPSLCRTVQILASCDILKALRIRVEERIKEAKRWALGSVPGIVDEADHTSDNGACCRGATDKSLEEHRAQWSVPPITPRKLKPAIRRDPPQGKAVT